MDDVDEIVLSSLKEIGYEVKSNFSNLKHWPFEDTVEMTIYCLNTIKPDLKFPPHLPPAMSAKFNMCAQLANFCKELGYKGEIGYHTFLYSNTTDIRNVLIFLVQHLPRRTTFEEADKSENKSSDTIRQKTAEELKKMLSSKSKEHYGMCQTPFISNSLETGTLLPNQKIDCKPLEWRDFVVEKLPFIDEQLSDYQYFLPSLISLNSYGKLNPKKPKCSNFNLRPLDESFFSAQSDSFNRSQAELPGSQNSSVTRDTLNVSIPESEGCLSEADKEAERLNLEKELEIMREDVTTLNHKLCDIVDSNDQLKKTLEMKNIQEATLQQSLVLLPDSDTNIPKLLAANEKCKNKMKNLQAQWQKHKETLLSRRDELKKITNLKTNEKNQLMESIMELRKELFGVVEQIEQKDLIEQKLSESNELKGTLRNDYIQRIFEIIKSIKKQGIQIDKILADMRYVQKEINALSGKINRSFALIEQLIVTNSKNDEYSHEIHKLVLALHKDVSDILTMTGEIGNYSRESKDLEEQLQNIEDSENSVESLQRVCADLKRIKEEYVILKQEVFETQYRKFLPKKPRPKTAEEMGPFGYDPMVTDEEFMKFVEEDFGYPYFAQLEAEKAAKEAADKAAKEAADKEAANS